MDPATLAEKAVDLANDARQLAEQAVALANQSPDAVPHQPFVVLFSVFVLACFVGYHVVWRVTPALH